MTLGRRAVGSQDRNQDLGRGMKPARNSGAERKPEEQVTHPFFILSWASCVGPKAAASPSRLTSPPQQLSQSITASSSGSPRKASHCPGLSTNSKAF